MKNFGSFFQEAVETSASRQAKLLGLVGNGHGDWYDKQGNLVAKTMQGKLHFFGGNQKSPEEDKPEKPAAPEPAKVFKRPKLDREEPKRAPGIVVVFGRFNPPTIGHKRLIDAAAREAKRTESDLKIYPSRTQDKKKNPLDPGMKINYMKQMFPDYEENIQNDADANTIFDVLTNAYNEGYTNATLMVGQDRLSEFQGLAQKYNGSDLYNFEDIMVMSGGSRDPDSDNVEGMSASKMRNYVTQGNFQSFAQGIPDTLKPMQKRELFNMVGKAMGTKAKDTQKEEVELWEIAPKLDPEKLREYYVEYKIFNIGDIVENLNTGLIGKITRRGTNHLICVTENGIMFKAWLKDLTEYTEVSMDGTMRDATHPNTLVGTNGFLKYVMNMTPGSEANKKFLYRTGGGKPINIKRKKVGKKNA